MGSTPVGYSASRIAALIGLSQYQTPFHAWQLIMEEIKPGWNQAHGYTLPVRAEGAPLRWGSAFESAILKLAEEKENDTITDREKYFSKQTGDITLTCHVDGIFLDGTIFEGKTANDYAFKSVKKEIIESLDENGKLQPSFKPVRSWGDDLSNEIPMQYHIQCAVQRVCSGLKNTRLYALVFPKPQADYEDLGWSVTHAPGANVEYYLENETGKSIFPMSWARGWSEQGQFHKFVIPSAPGLEDAIVESMQKFHEQHVVNGIPPDPTDFDDVRRLLPNPIGAVLATPELVTLCKECGENARQLGSASPLKKRQENVKVEIMTLANALRRSDPISPADKMLIINPNGGDVIGTLNKNINGVISFVAQRAK